MPTTPGGIWTPDDNDDWDLTVDLAATAVSIDDSIDTAIGTAISNMSTPYMTGTNAQRVAIPVVDLEDGYLFQTTDTNLAWVYRGTWLIAPGQVLASMVGPVGNTVGAGTLVGSVLSTPTLPVGQSVKVLGACSPFATTAGGIAEVWANWRNSASDVTATTYTGRQTSRGYSALASFVAASVSFALIATTTTEAKISAGMYTGTASSGVYGPDGTHFWIESA